MATKTIKANVQQRSDTASNWTEKNPVLLDGELAIVRTNAGETRVKIGDGVKPFTQLPYADERILNNVVTSINGQTGDVTLDAVQYTAQTLTAEQQKQVRENIKAAEQKLTAINCKYLINSVEKTETLYLERGDFIPITDLTTISDELKTAWQRVISLFGVVTWNTPNSTYRKFLKNFGILVKNNVFGENFFTNAKWPDNDIKIYSAPYESDTLHSIELWAYDSASNIGMQWTDHTTGASGQAKYDIATGEITYIMFKSVPTMNTVRVSRTISDEENLDSLVALNQINMAANPTADMQVATKKYVDDSIPTIPASLKNPNALTFTGAATGTYDGSEAVTINIPKAGAAAGGKLTFTGGATGEYDGSSDVSVAIPEDRFYILNIGEDADKNAIITNDYDEAKAAYESGKIFGIITNDGSLGLLNIPDKFGTDSVDFWLDIGEFKYVCTWHKTSKKVDSLIGSYPLYDYEHTLTSSGAAYWDTDKGWTIKDIDSDIYILNMVLETVDGTDVTKITNDFDEAKAAYEAGKIFGLKGANNVGDILFFVSNFSDTKAHCYAKDGIYVIGFTWAKATGIVTIGEQFEIPLVANSDFTKSGAVYWDKDQHAYILKDTSYKAGNGISISDDGTISATGSGPSSDYIINVTLGTEQSSVGNWVLGYSCTCDKTYAEVLAAYQSGANVIAHTIRNKEITLSDGSKTTIPIINEVPLTRYIAAQNLLVFDYVHNATDLSVSSGGLTYTTSSSGDSMVCYVATYQFSFGAADTSADNVYVPTTTKVQEMIDASAGSGGLGDYSIQVSNTAPPSGTSGKMITFVVEDDAT